jgi:endonuclease YncB( thermonuclease family)
MKKRLFIGSIIFLFVLITFGILLIYNFGNFPEEKDKVELAEERVSIFNESSFYVTRIIDGDTFELESGEIVRLLCVNAPEKGERGYEESKEFLSSLILNKKILMKADLTDKDKYSRLLRYVLVEDVVGNILLVNRELVNYGHAKIYSYGKDSEGCERIVGERV